MGVSQPENETFAIHADRVGMTFDGGSRAVADASFSIRAGEFVAIVGPSGCGKSTLLRMIAGLIAPTQGRISIGGQASAEARRRQRISFVFQDPRLLPWRTAFDNIRLPLELERIATRDHEAPIHAALRLVGLTPADGKKTPRMLSGGTRMRVSLARALITSPAVLLLDEPFAALDDLLRQQLNEELTRIWMQQRWTTLFVTHNVAEAVALSQRILVASAAPARIAAEVEIPFAYPRSIELRATPDFARLTGEVSRRMREAAQ